MACDLSAGRLVPCKDNLGGIQEVYFVDYGDITATTLTLDEVTDAEGTFNAYKYDLKGANSLETAITSSPDNGTTFYLEAKNYHLILFWMLLLEILLLD